MWSSSLAAVALAAALEASPAQNTARGHDYVLGNKFVEPITTVSGTAQTVRAQTPLHSWPRSLRSRAALRAPPRVPSLTRLRPQGYTTYRLKLVMDPTVISTCYSIYGDHAAFMTFPPAYQVRTSRVGR